MNANRNSSSLHMTRRFMFAILLAAAVWGSTSCTSSDTSKVSSPPSSVPPASPSPSESPAEALLKQAHLAANGLKKYTFELNLTQKLTGQSQDSNSTVTVKMNGRAELGPLKLDQVVNSDVDGEVYAMRAILVPDAYYMYDMDFEEWSKTSKEQTADLVKTLSDFQVNPIKALEGIQSLGSGLKADRTEKSDKITYEGNGPEAKVFLENVLESTLDLSGMDPKVRQSIKLGTLKVDLTLDPARHWPRSYQIESVMTVEYEAGKTSTLVQTMAGTYGKHNESDPVAVPEAAKNAPELDPPADNAEAAAASD
jgi:hypothetical protein